jgi:hypothetical protein
MKQQDKGMNQRDLGSQEDIRQDLMQDQLKRADTLNLAEAPVKNLH